jgi:hypothetical protein
MINLRPYNIDYFMPAIAKTSLHLLQFEKNVKFFHFQYF